MQYRAGREGGNKQDSMAAVAMAMATTTNGGGREPLGGIFHINHFSYSEVSVVVAAAAVD